MKNDQTTQRAGETEQIPAYEAPALTVVGRTGDVVQGVPMSGWDRRGYSAPEFEFEDDGE
jgi:hypothetical protein